MISEIQDYAIILLDIDGTILSWNAGAENIEIIKSRKFQVRILAFFICHWQACRVTPAID